MKLHKQGEDHVAFHCPGCAKVHEVKVAGVGSSWSWNGSMDSPTFTPSVKVESGHYIPGHSGSCWCTYNAEHRDDPASFACGVCHSVIHEGNIQFLPDCTHKFAGQTVPIPEWDDITT